MGDRVTPRLSEVDLHQLVRVCVQVSGLWIWPDLSRIPFLPLKNRMNGVYLYALMPKASDSFCFAGKVEQ